MILKRCSVSNLLRIICAKTTPCASKTKLYWTATPEGEFVWTGISDSFNPSSAKKAIDAVVKVVVKDSEKEGS